MRQLTRFLTPDEKAEELAMFEDYKALPGIWRRDHPDDLGGRGRIDHEVLPLCDRLNALDGVCTIQSCCGHRWPHPDGSGEVVQPGQLWIRLSEPVMRAVEKHVWHLLRHDVIRHVQKLYSFPYGRVAHEVLDICWDEGRMAEAETVIACFFGERFNLRPSLYDPTRWEWFDCSLRGSERPITRPLTLQIP